MSIKIEINIREHSPFLPFEHKSLEVRSRWFNGKTKVVVHCIEELLATKLRALYQRRKGRDLFDLATAIRKLKVDSQKVMETFKKYCEAEGIQINESHFRDNLTAKLTHPGFLHDCDPILRPGLEFDIMNDYELIDREFLSTLSLR